MTTFTKDQILEASSNCTTISAVARRLGCCQKKLSGGTAKMLRSLCPELEGILRGNKEGTSTVCPAEGKLSPNDIPDEVENPYRAGSTYAVIFKVGSTGYMTKAEIIDKVAAITGKPAKCIGYSLEVLCRKGHSSNHGSMALRNEDGKRT
jgi:hypothetical protein